MLEVGAHALGEVIGELLGRVFMRASSAASGAVSAVSARIRGIAIARTAYPALAVDEAEVEPGRGLTVAVRLEPKRDFHVARAVVQLIRVEAYPLDEGSAAYRWKTREEIVNEEVFMVSQDAHAMRAVDAAVEFVVPRDSLPTMRSRIVNGGTLAISWRVRVRFDIPNRFDPVAEQQISVSRPRAADVPPPRPAVAKSDRGGCSLVLSLDSADVVQGGSLTGRVRVQTRRDARISSAVVEFGGTRIFGNQSEPVDVDKSVLAEGVGLQAGRMYEWPFYLDTAEADVPSLRVGKSEVVYGVTAKLDRAMRRDPSVSLPVTVLPHCAE